MNRTDIEHMYENVEIIFMDEVYKKVKQGRSRPALRRIFDFFDKLLTASEFTRCDRVLSRMDFLKLDACTVLGLLAITYPARDVLSVRNNFLNKAKEYFQGQPEMISGLK